MGLRYLEHLLIMTHDPDATRDWFCHNLGMREGPHPEFGFPVHWLYIGERDVVHIAQARQSAQQDAYLGRPGGPGADPAPAVAGAPSVADGAKPAPEDAMGSGRIDHICFNCEGLDEFLVRFERNGVAFTERKARDPTSTRCSRSSRSTA
ncbi:MAG: VOC family protein [Burkholderiaceae bacterium]